MLSAALESAEHTEELGRGQRRDRAPADVWEQQVFERPDRLRHRLRGERLLREPFPRDRLKRIGAAVALGATLGGGIATRLERAA